MPRPKGGCAICTLPEDKRRDAELRRAAGEGATRIARCLEVPGITVRKVDYHFATCVGRAETESSTAHLTKIAELLDKSGIPIEEIARVTEVSLGQWQGFHKTGPKGEERAVKVDLERTGIKLTPKWADGPAWPVVQPVKPPVIKLARTKPRRAMGQPGWKTAVIYPDPQIGFRRLENGMLDPFHDVQAIDVGHQISEFVQPNKIINLGDFLDMSEASRFLKEPGFALTTQPSLEYGAEMLATQRTILDDTEHEPEEDDLVYLEGNHDFRLKRAILENAQWEYGLKRANVPDSWPVLSVPNLLGFDELGVTFMEGYPAGIFYVNDNFACIHGERVKSGGNTAALVIDDERVSICFGHVHRIEDIYKTVRTRNGAKTRRATSLGCLARTDGAVPSTKTNPRHDGKTPERQENWQQAVGVVTYEEGDGRFHLEVVPIFNGFAMFRGTLIESRVGPPEPIHVAA